MAAPLGGVTVCLDQMGPVAATSYPGQRVVRPAADGVDRVKQEIDYGRPGKGSIYGAFTRPAPSMRRARWSARRRQGRATYGKLILLGDPETVGELPMGQPRVIYPHGTEPGTPTL